MDAQEDRQLQVSSRHDLQLAVADGLLLESIHHGGHYYAK